jgi:hypothetical protein
LFFIFQIRTQFYFDFFQRSLGYISWNDSNGSELLTKEMKTKLLEFVGRKKDWRLCYDSKMDGTSVKAFHNHCDGKAPLLVIIQSKTNQNIFGGYTEIPFTRTGTYKTQKNSFLFLLKSANGILFFFCFFFWI